MNDLKIGQVVRSKAGRDKGQFMVVIGQIDKNYVVISNGRRRSASHPKKKKIKHLAKTNYIDDKSRNQILAGKMISDEEIRKILKSYEKPTDLGDENYEEV